MRDLLIDFRRSFPDDWTILSNRLTNSFCSVIRNTGSWCYLWPRWSRGFFFQIKMTEHLINTFLLWEFSLITGSSFYTFWFLKGIWVDDCFSLSKELLRTSVFSLSRHNSSPIHFFKQIQENLFCIWWYVYWVSTKFLSNINVIEPMHFLLQI